MKHVVVNRLAINTTYLFFGKNATLFMSTLMSESDMCSANWLKAIVTMLTMTILTLRVL